ncbi:PHA/PHB synthase family protein [Lacibacterium aquatile]|uniref:PHA/PHB synthase family protein n=1 Tax=Lacibacterium aquatile TaxID=1168082 RepID=A0ABW5DQJ9_9PROT
MDKKTENPASSLPDPVEWSRTMAEIAERSQKLVGDFLVRQKDSPALQDPALPLSLSGAFIEIATRMMADPARMMQAQFDLWQGYMSLWQSATRRLMGETDEQPLVQPAKDDKRFKDAAWSENVLFDYIKQSYLLTARWIQANVRATEGLDAKTARKVDFYTRQFVDAMAPSNFLMTNPEVLKATLESGGDNLLNGLQNLIEDLEKGDGKLQISMTDEKAFEVGRDIAVTPGEVVFENALIQLIQYTPTTDKVHKIPLLIIPPWINKFYILDLKEKNSFVKWAVGQGFTVFMISWVNPDEQLAAKSFEDYMLEGTLAALDAVKAQTGEAKANVIGYCLGGTLLASTLSYLAVKKKAPVNSATYFTTMVDFAESGELSVFIDEEQLNALEEKMTRTGYLEGREMATTFNMLRANDLIWSFVVNNYLLGKDPFPFDLLYWNADSTRMPAAMHSFYLRKMYQENLLCKVGGIELDGVSIDLRKIKVPSMIISTREDHIAPWKSTYAATQLYGGETKFVLAGSGHIAGIVNPPTAVKYAHWTNEKNPATPDEWLAGAAQHEGSWWPTWSAWLKERAGPLVAARDPKKGPLPSIEPAPGRYVKVRS